MPFSGPTVAEVIETLTEVVYEFGENYAYEKLETDNWTENSGTGGCLYVYNFRPSCIAAQCFSRWGVSTDILERFEGMSCDHVYEALYGKNSNSNASNTLRTAQIAQDAGNFWGLALERAKLYAAEVTRS